MRSVIKLVLLGSFVALMFSSCQDKELNGLMDDYCNCLAIAQNDEDKIGECVDKMEAIKDKYANAPQKLMKVLKKTNECD